MSEQSAPRVPRRPSVMAAGVLFFMAAAGLLLLTLLSAPIARALQACLPSASPEVLTLVMELVYYLPFMLLPVILYAKRDAFAAHGMRLNPISLRGTVLIAVMATAGVVLSSVVTTPWTALLEALGLDPDYAPIYIPSDKNGLLLYMLSAAVLPGICEELLFRGALLHSFERRGSRKAILFSALLFALMHGSVQGFPAQFLVGLVLGFVVVCFDSIYAGMIYHTAHNAAVLILNYLALRYSEAAGIADAVETAALTVGEILSTILQGLYYTVFFALAVFLVRGRLRRHGMTMAPDRKLFCNAPELAIILGGVVCCCGMYFLDVLGMLGM